MTIKERLVRWVGKRTGKAIGKRMGKVDDGTQKLAATTVGDKGIVAGGKSGLVALAVIALIRGMGVQLWDEGQDLEMSVAIVTVIGAIGTAYGSIKNVYTNWHLAKQNGVSVTRQKQPEEK